ncbi:MAG TPA: hypothetical protein VJB14_15000 [Planctomycetota bacterium]|nr:hypothetical protein [Planctomycetota bacterium]
MKIGRSLARLAIIALSAAGPGSAQEAKDRAAVAGVVKFKGPKPERKPNEGLLGQAFCKEACAGKAPLEEKWVFGKNGSDDTLANVLVYVSKGLEGKSFVPPKEPVVLDQVGCVYTPHVVALMVGQTLEIRNSDATLHNVMCNPFKNKPFNEGMPVKGGKIEKVFAKPEFKVDLRCVLHPWMLAYAHVLDHPFFAVTKEDGSFAIKGLPPGEYELSVKHEASRFAAEPATLTVKVGAGESKKIDFVYSDKQ